MTKGKTLAVGILFLLISILTVQGQTTFEVPQNVELKSREDYAKYENAIIDAAKWLEETDLNKEIDKRQKVNAFVMRWVEGSPTVNILITEKLIKICDKNTHLLGLYMASYSRYFLEHKGTATNLSAAKAGLLSIMIVYKKGINVTVNKEMDNLIELTNENELDEYIDDYFH
ncbi:MAG TPA: hypothetical protein PLW09_12440 [Candidatus Kapabacteria bacterium]|jgi:hypothetical protein|nr:hypothetical protein [Ignavibacteria bacterium]MBN8572687.1 hypothetical protein [Candidatus Kapabacteria bacterium]HRE58621.1 hypothetical protein [Candidatus Kapabacteria bacterium]HRK60772.1 hypothetical protein [Candidatus Kapabacteria bacterium]